MFANGSVHLAPLGSRVGSEYSEPFTHLDSSSRQRTIRLRQQDQFMEIDKGGRITETAVESRGGFLGRPVLVVLLASCALAIGFMIVSYVGVVHF